MYLYLPTNIELKATHEPDLLGGLTTLSGSVLWRDERQDTLYKTLETRDWKEIKTRFIPYHAWSNRGLAEMTVWLPLVWR